MGWKQDTRSRQRWRLIRAMFERKQSVRQLCQQYGISRQTAYKFKARFRREGWEGLKDRSRATQAARQLQCWRRRVLALRRAWPTQGARKLRWRLRQAYPKQQVPSVRTIERWLKAAGLVRRQRRSNYRAGAGVGPRCVTVRRCNQVWTVDFKGWFRTRNGRRVEPLTVRDLHSRFILSATSVGRRNTAQVGGLFRSLFRRYGVPESIRSDRGSPFCGNGPYGLTKLSLEWYRLGIRVQFVRRGAGINNNAHEQMHQVLQREVAAQPAVSYRKQQRALEAWRQRYNFARPHEALGMRPPGTRYRYSSRRVPRLRRPTYPTHWLTRCVHKGQILWQGRRWTIGRAFDGLPVGLKPHRAGHVRVFFQDLMLGELRPHHSRVLHRVRARRGG